MKFLVIIEERLSFVILKEQCLYKRCELCNKEFDELQLTKEHYPAKSVGNNDLVLINLFDVCEDMIQAPN